MTVIAHLNEMMARGSALRIARELPRGEFFAGLLAVDCVSGLASRIIQSVNRLGWVDALFNTFEISAIVLISCAAGVSLVLETEQLGFARQSSPWGQVLSFWSF